MAGYLVIVRRGEPDRFQALETIFETDPEVTVCWDRRQAWRRLGRQPPPDAPDRRRTRDRRRPPPVTWTALDFVVATGEAPR
jgi:hypothetical protein